METFEERCRKHPYQPVVGVCAYCLSDRLRLLCPDCAAPRPCKCLLSSGAASSENLSTSSASSSFSSSFDHPKHPPSRDGIGAVGRISILIDAEPPFRRCKSSRVAGISFLRSRSRVSQRWPDEPLPTSTPSGPRKKWSLWSFLLPDKSKKEPKPPSESPTATKLRRSRSVGVSYSSHSFRNPAAVAGGGDRGGGGSASVKGRGWSFSSPINVFRQTKTVNGRSPMCRG
ncbi:uncharacterized protein LOC116253247 [Nymphaea colorata]|nr:uncharacterized protein LOC116253247 [Nymphaea colorata]